jgi:hypothetical protein
VTDTDARLWHPWLRIGRVLGVMLRSSATRTARERTPWHATQRAAWMRYDRSVPRRGRAAHDFDATVVSRSPRRAVPQVAVLFSFLLGPLRGQSTPNTDEVKERGESTYENHEPCQHHLWTLPVASRMTGRAVWAMPDTKVPLFATEGLQRILKLLHARKSQA